MRRLRDRLRARCARPCTTSRPAPRPLPRPLTRPCPRARVSPPFPVTYSQHPQYLGAWSTRAAD
eukprot:3086569-Prymnesium_polylepis.1